MKILKNKDRFITFLSIAIIVISPILLLIKKQFHPYKIKNNKQTQTSLLVKTGRDHAFTEKAPPYKYDKMLKLLTRYHNIEKNFYATFPTFITNRQNLDKLNSLLAKLKDEKGLFKSHLKSIRVSYRRNASNKKKNSLRYYFRVLEDSIDDLEYMIEKFNPKDIHPTSKKGRMA